MPGKLYKNSTGQLRVQFVNELTGAQITTGTATVTVTDSSGAVVVNAAVMTYDAAQQVRAGVAEVGCWTYTIASTALPAEEEVTVQYDLSSGGIIAQVVEQIPVEVNTGR